MTTAEFADSHALVEGIIGRRLSEAERAIDVLGIDAKLNREKDALERAAEEEKTRAILDFLRGGPGRLRVTEDMRDPLRRLNRFGRKEALAELRRLGYQPREPTARAFEEARDFDRDLEPVFGQLDREMGGLTVRVRDRAVDADFGDVVGDALARELLRTPGARTLAAALVSAAFTSGLGATFEENEDLIGGWEYTSVLDAARCDVCRSKHGTTYRSWAEAQVDLPGGGPNPGCYGGGRCRCRLVPLPF